MKLQDDLREFIELLNLEKVDYVVMGGHAVGFHGYPRFTGDIDLWIRPAPANALRVVEVLKQFGFPDADTILGVLSEPGRMLQLGAPPNRIDLLTSVSGIDFDTTWGDTVPGEIDDLPVRFPSLEVLLQNKRASGRPKDLADVDQLEKVARQES